MSSMRSALVLGLGAMEHVRCYLRQPINRGADARTPCGVVLCSASGCGSLLFQCCAILFVWISIRRRLPVCHDQNDLLSSEHVCDCVASKFIWCNTSSSFFLSWKRDIFLVVEKRYLNGRKMQPIQVQLEIGRRTPARVIGRPVAMDWATRLASTASPTKDRSPELLARPIPLGPGTRHRGGVGRAWRTKARSPPATRSVVQLD